MKKAIYMMLIAVVVLATACYEDYEKPFDYTAVYFPHQQPMRTVTLEDSVIEVGIVLGGKRDNTVNEYAYFSKDDALLTDSRFAVLPSTHYKLRVDEDSLIKIPSGSFQGEFELVMTDEFYNDALSYQDHYILPLKLVQFTTDSVLYGKHYTLLMVKYINDYHGTYYRMGADSVDVDNVIRYSTDTLVYNETVDLSTLGQNKLLLPAIGKATDFVDVLELTIDMETMEVSGDLSKPNAQLAINDFSGVVKDNTISYSYTYEFDEDSDPSTASDVHYVSDSLVFRDNGIRFEKWE
ncbi:MULTISPECIES: DUF1735 domain-containing protein [Reichenbachiella]|uniref:DUF1735 domain-containing protein n=1 Tax=Reichenbachiella agariperforans TaxID=156994 RepID=A0A1M6UEA4_REIAG|nr:MULTISPECIES: DUF1735 domain-containing protein [Reichenbachiella]MBU2912596.1 hypothetical protein [Reichenbachiella agariperforans]RJE72549.1 hypothetical protein BGP76_00840 [Reichenbachiella sp. MSK19-1]SHK67534.1 hypothetical protein SAMN04488028_10784 [Reichenbachiella agariperforans]